MGPHIKAVRKALRSGDIRKIRIIAHTGQDTYVSGIHEELRRIVERKAPFPEVQLLVRSPLVEVRRRGAAIRRTVGTVAGLREELKGAQLKSDLIDVRFYQAIPFLSGFECTTKSRKKELFLSAYMWTHGRSRISRFPIADTAPLRKLFHSWFSHCWGVDDVHTIVFDFDGTLVDSFWAQVAGWCEALKVSPKNELKESFATALSIKDPRTLRSVVGTEFATYQGKAKELRTNFWPEYDKMEDPVIQRIDTARRKTRKAATLKSVLFANANVAVRRLQSDGRVLAIISASESATIKDFLAQRRNAIPPECFAYIIGSDEPTYFEEDPLEKAGKLMKLAALLGVPVERMIYVGDAQSDYDSAHKLGVPFLWAQLIPKDFETAPWRVFPKLDGEEHSFRHYGKEFLDEITRICEECKRRKYAPD